MKVAIAALKPGDVIRTNPQEGYWGCAVVLDRIILNPPFNSEVCHIATTCVVRKNEFTLEEVDSSELEVLEFEKHYSPVRDSLYVKTELCIQKYPLVAKHAVELIGSIDPVKIYNGPLSADIGGHPGGFPLQNRIDKYLGNEAVITWRRKYDKDAWDAFVAVQDAAYFDQEEERLRKNREARNARTKKNT
jgi:hypothetical protein